MPHPAPILLSHARSLLYVPADKPRALAKLASLGCDAAIVDLEDAVAPDAKVQARQGAAAFLAAPRPAFALVLRVNALDTGLGADDLAMAAAARPAAVLLPKTETGRQLQQAAHLLDQAGGAATPVLAMIETPAAFPALGEIVSALPGRLAGLVIGTNDLAKAMRIPAAAGVVHLHPLLMLAVAAARGAGLGIFDGVFNAIDDPAGFAESCARGRAMGFDGKTLIHPSQIEACNRAFSPGPDEIEAARAVVAAFAQPENAGKGVIRLDGRMVERLHLEDAEQILARVR